MTRLIVGETVIGCDVSFNQGEVDWQMAADKDDVRPGFIRWTQHPWKDSQRVNNWIKAKETKVILRAPYIVYVPNVSGELQAQFFAQDFAEQIGEYESELPGQVDLELFPIDWVELERMFLGIDRFTKAMTGCYTGAWVLNIALQSIDKLPDWFVERDFWLTGYNNEGPDLVSGYDLAVKFWQRTSSWVVDWVTRPDGRVDRSDWIGDQISLWEYANMGDRVVKVDDLTAFLKANAFECEDTPTPPQPPEAFKLIWPTPLPKFVTQWYGINPQWYEPFGLPGHEGIDLRAANGVEIYAGAKGQVIRVEPADTGAYGVHVRIEHVQPGGTFKTVYAHFQQALVSVGDVVEAGQPIGLADNTGNSSGAHLHVTLKHVGQGSPWMNTSDIINPVPYMPDLFPVCTLDGYTGKGWLTDVGGNFRRTPEIPANPSENLIRWIPAGLTGQATGKIGGDGGDWWEMIFDGTTGFFWNPGYKLRAL